MSKVKNSANSPKPFLKWAGGKSQLLDKIRRYYPFNEKITKYAEPFVGGGAVLFDVLSNYDLEEVYVSDANKDLINVYTVIRDNPDELIPKLKKLEDEFLSKNENERKEMYNKKRDEFNRLKKDDNSNSLESASLLLFLNKTCFNGLYRVNKDGLFNVPAGRYKNPTICDEVNLRLVSQSLQNVKIVNADFDKSYDFIDEKTFVYFDPPYRPLSDTSNFNTYHKEEFNDESQIKLAEYVKKVVDKGAYVLVSNSDPKNVDENDNFFDNLYSGLNINRVKAKRFINSKATGRGEINELLITNIEKEENNE